MRLLTKNDPSYVNCFEDKNIPSKILNSRTFIAWQPCGLAGLAMRGLRPIFELGGRAAARIFYLCHAKRGLSHLISYALLHLLDGHEILLRFGLISAWPDALEMVSIAGAAFSWEAADGPEGT
jgi:hypothetical protein